MRSESKWKRETLQSYNDNGYMKDDTTDMSQNEAPISKMLGAIAIIGAGVGLYKAGGLKNIIKHTLEYTAKYKPVTPMAAKEIKKWLARDMEEYSESIFRNGLKDNIKKIFNNTEDVIYDTKRDLKHIKETISTNTKKIINDTSIGAKINKDNHSEYDLFKNIEQMERVIKEIDPKLNKAKGRVKNEMIKNIIKRLEVNDKFLKKQVKRTGYRTATFEDLFHFKTLKSGRVIVASKRSDFDIDDETINKINNFLNTFVKMEDGTEKTIYQLGFHKKIMLDKNILIEETGKNLINTKNADNVFKDFVKSMANDYSVPFLNLNPLKMFEIDKKLDNKIHFGIFHSETIQPALTNKAGRVKLKDVYGNNPLIYIDGNVFKIDENEELTKVASNMKIFEIKDTHNEYNIPREIESLRKIANLKFREFKEIDPKLKETDPIEYYKNEIFKKLSLGRQDFDPKKFQEEGIKKYFDLSYYIEEFTGKIFKKIMPYDYVERKHNMQTIFGDVEEGKSIFVASKKSYKIFDSESDKDIGEQLYRYFAQFISGRNGENISENVTSATTMPYFIFERVNASLNTFNLGLSVDDMGSSFDILKNMLIKRFLPIYLGYNAYEYINYLTEDEENGDNITKKTARAIAKVDLGWHKIKDVLGITSVAKELSELTPGSEQLTELPGINMIDFKMTYDEREEYYENGVVPVRKGRFWDLGNTPFTGGKIMYYQPNLYRRIMADAKFSDSLYGSREEYFANAPFPTPTHMFAPIKHFFTDKYHWEEKHYYDRPYMLTSPAFEDIPIFGPILSNTIGKIIKPQKIMHEEYWPQSDEVEQAIYNNENNEMIAIPTETDIEDISTNNKMYAVPVAKPTDTSENLRVLDKIKIDENVQETNKNTRYEAYTTKTGDVNVVDVKTKSLSNTNKELENYSIKKIFNVDDNISFTNNDVGYVEEVKNPSDIDIVLGNQFDAIADFAGIYGFALQGFVTGEPNNDETVIETSGYMTSFSRDFWDQELGGVGGQLSEIFRRFVRKRNNNIEYYNPIRNTMPEWMPNEEYFIDFKHGDPYTKVQKGELRLPGEGYERLHGIDPLAFKIGSSHIGKSESDIIKHYLNQDIITDDDTLDILDSGTKIHKEIEEQWMKKGLAIDVEGEIKDEENNILGFYDARIKDGLFGTGEAIAEIKTVNPENFDKIKEQPKEHHLKQLNYYLWATGLDKGYIYYVNRDNLDQIYTYEVKYSEDLLKETLETLNNARQKILEKIENGEISKYDLYSSVDKYRILADVAPYSKEFAEMKKLIQRQSLSDAEKKEIQKINEQVSNMKEPLRLYPYKFKTANIEYETVHITKILDSNTFLTEEHPDNPIRLAGIQVNNASEMTEEAQEYFNKYLYEGAKVTIGVDADPLNRISKDTYKTIKAVVFKGNTNVNRLLLNKGYATEKENDWSAPAVHARFNAGEIMFGSLWERFAHLDTFIHTKFLQVRSPLESYERREVYGKNFQTWDDFYDDYVKPTYESYIHNGAGLIYAGVLGYMFGRTKYGKLTATLASMAIVGIGKLYKNFKEIITGKEWIPERREKERELNEYIDILKFIKNKKLFEEYTNKALKEDNFNVKEYIKKNKEEGQERKNRLKELLQIKKDIKFNPDENPNMFLLALKHDLKYFDEMFAERVVEYKNLKIDEIKDKFEQIKQGFKRIFFRKSELTFETFIDATIDTIKDVKKIDDKYDEERKKINKRLVNKMINNEINDTNNYRKLEAIPTNAAKALYYYNEAEQTMYGYDPGEPLSNVLKALPKKDREYVQYFLNAPEEERDKILKIVPDYMKRILQSSWGMKVDKKPKLDEYFKEHFLPGEDWIGWDENINLDLVKVKMVKKEKLEFDEFNIWEEDIKKANAIGEIPLPKINYRTDIHEVRNKLNKLLTQAGVSNINIDIVYTNAGLDVEADIRKRKSDTMLQQDIETYLKDNMVR